MQTKMGFVGIRCFSTKHIVCFPSGILNIYNAFSNLIKHLQKVFFFLSICIADRSLFSFTTATFLQHISFTCCQYYVITTHAGGVCVCVCADNVGLMSYSSKTKDNCEKNQPSSNYSNFTHQLCSCHSVFHVKGSSVKSIVICNMQHPRRTSK